MEKYIFKGDLNEGFCIVKNTNNLFGYVNESNEEVITPVYSDAKDFHNGLAPVKKDYEWGLENYGWGLIDKFGNDHIPFEYEELNLLNDKHNYYIALKDGFYGIISQKNKLLIPFKYQSTFKYFYSNRILTSSEGKFGFVDINGRVIIPFKYDEVIFKDENLFNVRIDNCWGILNLSGLESHIKYTECISFDQNINVAIVKDIVSGKSGCVNSIGNEIVPTIYDHIFFDDSNKFIFVGLEGYLDTYISNSFSDSIQGAKWGCYNCKGIQLLPIKYDRINIIKDYISAGRDGRSLLYGNDLYYRDYDGEFDLYSFEGKLLCKNYNDIELTDHFILLHYGGKYTNMDDGKYHFYDYQLIGGSWFVFDRIGKRLLSNIKKKFDSIIELSENLLEVKTLNEEYGILNVNNPIEENIKYDKIGIYKEGRLCQVILNRYYGFISNNGDEIITPQYLSISQFNEEIAYAMNQEKKCGMINTVGEIIIPFEFDMISCFAGKHAIVSINENEKMKYGIIDSVGKLLLPLIYDYIEPFRYFFVEENEAKLYSQKLYAIVSRDDKYGLFDVDGKEIIPVLYDKLDIWREKLGIEGNDVDIKYPIIIYENDNHSFPNKWIHVKDLGITLAKEEPEYMSGNWYWFPTNAIELGKSRSSYNHSSDRDSDTSIYDNPYYNEVLDMDQQDIEFWNCY